MLGSAVAIEALRKVMPCMHACSSVDSGRAGLVMIDDDAFPAMPGSGSRASYFTGVAVREPRAEQPHEAFPALPSATEDSDDSSTPAPRRSV